MTPQQARELFSDAYEGELDDEQQRAFEEALAADATLREEYETFRATLQRTHRIAATEHEAAPDLLTGVQTKLHRRSRGRYYRDRFSQKKGAQRMLPLLLAIVMLAIVGVAWFALRFVEVQGGAAPAELPAEQQPSDRQRP